MSYYNILEIIDKFTSVILSCASTFGIAFGLLMAHNYKSKIKDNRYSSLFSFYSKFNVYLLDFKCKIGDSPSNTILLCKYNENSIRNNENFTKPNDDEIKSFIKFIQEFIDFFKNTENQIPFDVPDYNDDFKQLKDMLFSLTRIGKITPYTYNNNNELVINDYNKTITLVDKLLEKIENEQNRILGQYRNLSHHRNSKI